MSGDAPRQLHLNINALHSGFVPSAWRLPDSDPNVFLDVNHYVRLAQLAERACLDAIFLADNAAISDQLDMRPITALEPTMLLTSIAAATTHLGLIATASTSYNEPYNIARRFATLDLISGGRAGWNIVTTADLPSARNFGHDTVPDHATRYARADEFAALVKTLWNSWDDDAFVADKSSGRFVDLEKVHPADHRGRFFSVRGALNLPRSAQGHPVLVQAGASGDGRELAARHAEAVFSASQSFDESRGYREDLNARAARYGRGPNAVKVLAGLTTIIGSTESEALRRRDELVDLIPVQYSLNRIAGTLGIPVDSLSLDKRLPDDLPLPNGGNGNHTFFNATLAQARTHGYTVRELIRALAGGGGHRVIVGTPEQVANDIEHWFRNGAADGFNLMPDVLPDGLEAFTEGVVPILQQRGIFRRAYEGKTLRSHLGLSVPEGAVLDTH
ncbi:LLM class flavin-dependent oxidoreductase [Caballeronia sp. J97]|uniref:LLM class flavin-dependent oxidoreductase n=1 Tax=Caballeronia sp. J97 TaxID=2805429 RepID=UPI002AB312BE|nr:LLM class flavin-dependent oxidoreductase [Caballeronia sp. J97]